MRGSILVDWYTAKTVGALQNEAAVFLGVMDALRRPDVEEDETSHLAFAEIARLAPWARIYALPALCRCARSLLSIDQTSPIWQIVAPILGEDDVLTGAFAAFATGKSAPHIASALEAAAKSLRRARMPSPGYDDIEEHDECALILSMLLVLCGEDPTWSAENLESLQEGKRSPSFLSIALDNALNHQFGRYCALLAADVCLQMRTLRKHSTIRQAIISLQTQPLLHPDLVVRLATLEFGRPLGADERDVNAGLARISEELITFQRWMRFGGESPALPAGQRAEALIYWQDALWHLAVDLSPLKTAAMLNQVWLPRVMRFPQSPHVVPVARKNLNTLKEAYDALLGMLWNRPGELQLELGADPARSTHWHILSPWLEVRRPPPRNTRGSSGVALTASERDGTKTDLMKGIYPQRFDPNALLRCISAAYLDLRLVLSAADTISEDGRWHYFIAHILHAIDVLSPFEYTLSQRETIPSAVPWPVQILSACIRRLAIRAVGGRFTYTSPEVFLRVVQNESILAEQDSHVSGRTLLPPIVEVVTRIGLCAAMLDGFGHATQGGAIGYQRWLDHVLSLADLFERLREAKIDWSSFRAERLLCQLILRFYAPDRVPPERWRDDWIKRLSETPRWPRQRSLLLTGPRPAADWLLNFLPPLDEERQQPLSLILSCERVAAALSDPACPTEYRDRWTDDLRKKLEAVHDRLPLDRFLRLRLIELLRLIPLNYSDLTRVIVGRLLEFGSVQDLHRLASWFGSSRIEAPEQVESWVALFRALVRLREHRWHSRADRDQIAKDPDERREESRRLQLLDSLLVASWLSPTVAHTTLSELAIALARKARERSLIEQSRSDFGMMLQGTADETGRFVVDPQNKRSWLGENLATAAEIVSMVVDWNTETAQVLDLGGGVQRLVNLFPEGSAKRPTQAGAEHGVDCIGVVEHHLSTTRIAVRVSRQREAPIEIDVIRVSDWPMGALLAIGCRLTEKDVVPIPSQSLRPLPLAGESDPAFATVYPADVAATPTHIPVKIGDAEKFFVSLRNLTSNFAALNRPTDLHGSYSVLFQRAEQRNTTEIRWAPSVLASIDFLLDLSSSKANLGLVVVCLAAVEFGFDRQPVAVIVETLPLQWYRLVLDSDFTREATAAIRQRIEELEEANLDPVGLLLSLTITAAGNRPPFDLAAPSPSGAMWPLNYPELAVPFDMRNIHWRHMFDIEAAATENAQGSDEDEYHSLAKIDEKQRKWMIELPKDLPGFPKYAQLKITLPASASTEFVLAERRTWDPLRTTIRAEKAPVWELTPDSTISLTALAINVLSLPEISIAEIVRFGSTVTQSGFVTGYTKNNLPIKILAETLSMRPIEEGAVRSCIGGHRKVLIIFSNWLPMQHRPIFDITHVPPAAYIRGEAVGLIYKLPQESAQDQAGYCGVAWRTPTGIIETSILVDNLGAFINSRPRLDQGGRLVVPQKGVPHIDTLLLLGEALWREEVLSDRSEDISPPWYIGSAIRDGKNIDVYESLPGFYFTKSSQPQRPETIVSRFLSQLSSVTGGAGKRAAAPIFEERKDETQDRWNRKSHLRSRLAGPDGVLCGTTYIDRPSGSVRILELELLLALSTEGQWRLRRRWRCEQAQRPRRSSKVFTNRNVETERQQWLSRNSELIIEGEYDENKHSLRPADFIARRLFPGGLQVAPNGFTRLGHGSEMPGGRNPFPGRTARARLTDTDKGMVSFIQVDPLTLRNLRASVGDPANDEIVSPGIHALAIYCVGGRYEELAVGKSQELRENLTEEQSGGRSLRYFRFEWGYGYWTEIPETLLRYQGKPIRSADHIFFSGDQITALRFIEIPSMDTDGSPTLILSIEGFAASRSHGVYRQASRYRIVHTLHVSVRRSAEESVERPIIVQVDGFENLRHDDGREEYHNLRANLDEAGELVIKARAEQQFNHLEHDEENYVLLGRLDQDRYRVSFGDELVFRYTRMDSIAQPGAEALRSGDRIFAVADVIAKHGDNDCALLLRPEPGLAPEDVGPLFRPEGRWSFRIRRRKFSYREQLLRNLFEQDKKECLRGRDFARYLLVQVSFDLPDRLDVDLRRGTPARSAAVLPMLLADEPNGLLAIYGGPDPNSDDLKLFEFLPGIIVAVPTGQFEMPEGLLRGDVVLITATEYADEDEETSVVVTRSVYGDLRYAKQRRGVVVFPMQNMASDWTVERVSSQLESFRISGDISGSFVVGDLVELRANLRMSARDRGLEAPRQRDFVRFMSLEHPKTAWLRQAELTPDETPVATITPDFTRTLPVGRLVINGEELAVAVEPLEVGSPQLHDAKTDWYFLTFREVSARELIADLRRERWHFTDRKTVVWQLQDDGQYRATTPFVPDGTVANGPIFFEMIREWRIACLRYPNSTLAKHAFGYSTLLDALRLMRPNDPIKVYAVAGIPEEGGLYIELMPGRVLELPPTMAMWSREEDDHVTSLSSLDWSQFAPGDRIELQCLTTTELYSVPRVRVRWQHGVRNAFGPAGAVLPRLDYDPGIGLARYGAGNVIVNVPSSRPESLAVTATIGQQDQQEDLIATTEPRHGQTVLLVVTNQGRIGVAGFPGWSVAPASEWDWATDSLMYSVVTKTNGSVRTDWSRLSERIRLAGNALAVTVEGVIPGKDGGKTIFFSRWHQRPSLPLNKCAEAKVLGEIGTSGLVMMTIGGRSFAMAGERLLTGVSPALRRDLINAMTQKRVSVWVRGGRGGFEIGIRPQQLKEFNVRSLMIMGSASGQFVGVLCEEEGSRKLFWLPAEKAAATYLTLMQAELVFRTIGRIVVCMTQTGQISASDHPRARRELRSLVPGERLSVEILGEAREIWSEWAIDAAGPWRDRTFFLVRSRATSMVMLGVGPGERLTLGQGYKAEVQERRNVFGVPHPLLVPEGDRIVTIDCPHWLSAACINDSTVIYQPSVLDGVQGGKLSPVDVVDSFRLVRLANEPCHLDQSHLLHFAQEYCMRSTVSLLAGIGTATLLNKASGTASAAAKDALRAILVNLALRSARSVHVEILAKNLRRHYSGVLAHGTTELVAKRFASFMNTALPGGRPHDVRDRLNRLLDALPLSGADDDGPDALLAQACAAAVGTPADLRRIRRGAEILTTVGDLLRSNVLLLDLPPDAVDRTIEELAVVGERLLADGDLPLVSAMGFSRKITEGDGASSSVFFVSAPSNSCRAL